MRVRSAGVTWVLRVWGGRVAQADRWCVGVRSRLRGGAGSGTDAPERYRVLSIPSQIAAHVVTLTFISPSMTPFVCLNENTSPATVPSIGLEDAAVNGAGTAGPTTRSLPWTL